MPTYVYRCADCGDQLEVVQSFSDDPLTVCPTCDGALRKVFQPVGVVFKGSGFYKTDNRPALGKRDTKAVGSGTPKPAIESGGKKEASRHDSSTPAA